MVARSEIARAVSLGAVAFNVARALGPALAGAIAAALSSGTAMLVAAIFFVVMMVAVYPKTGPRQADSRRSGDAAVGDPERAPLRPPLGADARARHPQRRASACARARCGRSCRSSRATCFRLGAGGYGTLIGELRRRARSSARSAIPRLMSRRSLNSIVTSGVVLWAVAAR